MYYHIQYVCVAIIYWDPSGDIHILPASRSGSRLGCWKKDKRIWLGLEDHLSILTRRGFPSHGGVPPSYHPCFWVGFSILKHPAIGVPPMKMETPILENIEAEALVFDS